MVHASYAFDDMNVASELGLNVAMTDAEDSNPDCEKFSNLHYRRNESGLWFGYDAYIIPALTGRSSLPTLREEE